MRAGDLVGLVERSCRTHADRLAVRTADGQRTFREVWDAALGVTATLVSRGVAPGEVVGLWAVKDADLIAGLVGILAAGAAYLPLDPSLPTERLAFMVEDAQPRVIVAGAAAVAEAGGLGLPVVGVGPDGAQDGTGDRPVVGPEVAAYVIYTSGSTGRPKGVVVERGGVVGLLTGMIDDLRLGVGDVFVGTAPLIFDASVPNVLLPLMTGGTLVLPSPAVARDPFALAALVDEVGADVLKCSNSVLRMLCASGWGGRPALKVVTGGEMLPPAVAVQLLSCVGELWNYYGPTETTVSSTRARVVAGDTEPVPIGWAMPGVGYRVLDPDRVSVEPGGVGELWISGPGVARGYLHDEARTAQRFVALADGGGPPVRGYLTGDMVRERADGALVLLGRSDDQVKLNGFRIELAEIESRLSEHPGVVQAVVVVNTAQRGQGRLVAFVQLSASGVGTDELLEFAARLLPAWMVPSAVVVMDGFPVTPGGKVDRRGLAERVVEGSGPGGGAIVDPLQGRVAGVMASVLGLAAEGLGPSDDFFALGGQSILALELMSALSRELDVRLPLSILMTEPTVAGLAGAVTDVRRGMAHGQLVRLRDGPGAPLFVIHDSTGDLLPLQELIAALPEGRALYGLRMPGADRSGPLPFDLEALVDRYLAEVRTIVPDGPYCFAGYSFGGLIAYLMAARLAEAGTTTDLVALLDTAPPQRVLRTHNPLDRTTGGVSRGWRGQAHHLRITALGVVDLVRDRAWRLVALPLWVKRGRVLPPRLHSPTRVLRYALSEMETFPTYDGRVVEWWGDNEDNISPRRMTSAWNTLIARGIDVRLFADPGATHFQFLKGRGAAWVSHGLAEEMERIDRTSVADVTDRARTSTSGG